MAFDDDDTEDEAAKKAKAKFIDMTGPSGEEVLRQLEEDLNDAKNH